MTIRRLVSRSIDAIGRRLTASLADLAARQHLEAVEYHRDALSVQHLQPLLGRQYLPWSNWSIRPTSLVALANEIVMNDCRTVLECGSGISTIILGKLLQERAGRLISIEHDERWRALIQRYVDDEGIGASVTLVHAPLVPWVSDGGEGPERWYDTTVVQPHLHGVRLDMILVDGPPQTTGRMARLPAVPYLKDHLSERFVVALDDINRSDEAAIIRVWQQLLADRSVELRVRPGERVGFLRGTGD